MITSIPVRPTTTTTITNAIESEGRVSSRHFQGTIASELRPIAAVTFSTEGTAENRIGTETGPSTETDTEIGQSIGNEIEPSVTGETVSSSRSVPKIDEGFIRATTGRRRRRCAADQGNVNRLVTGTRDSPETTETGRRCRKIRDATTAALLPLLTCRPCLLEWPTHSWNARQLFLQHCQDQPDHPCLESSRSTVL